MLHYTDDDARPMALTAIVIVTCFLEGKAPFLSFQSPSGQSLIPMILRERTARRLRATGWPMHDVVRELSRSMSEKVVTPREHTVCESDHRFAGSARDDMENGWVIRTGKISREPD